MTLNRVNVVWSQWPGAPGISTFYFGAIGTTTVDAVSSFFDAIKSLVPLSLTFTVPSTGDEINEATGQITGVWNATPTTPTRTGTVSGAYAGNAGAVVHWLTPGVIGGRRVRGSAACGW